MLPGLSAALGLPVVTWNKPEMETELTGMDSILQEQLVQFLTSGTIKYNDRARAQDCMFTNGPG